MDRYTPPGVLVNENLEVLQFRGHTGPYLDPAPGVATLSLLKIARGDLLYQLRNVLQKCKKTSEAVRSEDIKVKFDGQTLKVNLQVIPLSGDGYKQHFLVLFEQAQGTGPAGSKVPELRGRGKKVSARADKVSRLEEELKIAKEFLRSSLADQEAANEELRTSNEEFLSANEELQTTNEELETAKEELQSTNEELTTLNEELQNRNLELSKLDNDLRNTLNCVYGGIAVVDQETCLRFFDPRAAKILNLIASDVGRPIGNIKPNIELPEMGKLTAQVITDSVSREVEATTPEGLWYKVRIQPYVVAKGGVEGAVITLADSTEQHTQEAVLRNTQRMFEQLFEASPDAILTVDESGRILRINAQAESLLLYRRDELIGQPVEVLVPERFRPLHRTHRQGYQANPRIRPMSNSLELYAKRKDKSELPVDILLSPLDSTLGRQTLAVIHDISLRKQADDLTRHFSMRRIQVQDEERQRVSRELHAATGSSLSALVMNLAMAQRSVKKLDPAVRKALRESLALAKRCAEDIRTLAYQLHPPLLDEAGLKGALSWYLESYSRLTGIKVHAALAPQLDRLPKDVEVGLFHIAQEALANIQRHAKSEEVKLRIGLTADAVTLRVEDRGKGIAKNAAEGLGIRGMRERVQLLKGKFEIASSRHGTELTASIPLPPPAPTTGKGASPKATTKGDAAAPTSERS